MTRIFRPDIYLISLIFLAGIVILPAIAVAGPVRFRPTLLALYRQSDVIFIGRFDKKEDFGTNRVGNGFTVVTTRTFFDVSTVLKGEPRKFAVVEDEEFRYQIQPIGEGQAPRDAVFVEDIESMDAGQQPKPGDTVLVFLKGNGDSFELADQRDGARKLSPGEESVFADRIGELNSIFANEKPDSSRIADWLVRCAAQTATRWDGAHELLQGFRRLEWQKDTKHTDGIDPLATSSEGMDAANVLSDEQRAALTQILLVPDAQTGQPGSKQMSDGNRELIALVKRWDSSFAAGYLLAQLRSRAFSDHENAGMMYTISELLNDKTAQSLARRYAEMSVTDDAAAGNAAGNRSTSNVEVRANTLASFLSVAGRRLLVISAKSPC